MADMRETAAHVLEKLDEHVLLRVRAKSKRGALALVTLILLLLSMASGIHALTPIGYALSIVVATVVLWVTVMLRVAIREAGVFEKIELSIALAAILGASAILAVGGAAYVTAPEKIAQNQFVEAAKPAFVAIDQASLSLDALATTMRTGADMSKKLSGTEASVGGTCGVSSKPEPGPISKMRASDAVEMNRLASQIEVLSQRARGAKARSAGAIDAYKLDQHVAVAGRFAAAMTDARTAVASPQIDEAFAFAAERSKGGRNAATGKPVACPQDPLIETLKTVLQQPRPLAPTAPTPPPQPTHGNVVMGLMDHIAAVPTNGFDFGTYGLALVGLLFDLIFQTSIRIPDRTASTAKNDPFRYIRKKLGLSAGADLDEALAKADVLREKEGIAGEFSRALIIIAGWRGRAVYYVAVPVEGDEYSLLRDLMDLLSSTGEAWWKASGPATAVLKGTTLAHIRPDDEIDLYALRPTLWPEMLRAEMAA